MDFFRYVNVTIKKIKKMRTLEEILKGLNEEQKLLLADTINYGSWGDCDMEFNGKTFDAWGYITDDAYMGNHFVRRELSLRFKNLFKALGLVGTNREKTCGEFTWVYDWWEDGSGSVLFIRDELVEDFEKWAENYK